VEKKLLAGQVEVSNGAENMDDDEGKINAHGTHYLQRGNEGISSGPEVHVVLKRMHECVRILKSWNVF
jgi:hypothetical protein